VRLGRAQAESGDLRGALASFLRTSPRVARKNLARIGLLKLALEDNTFDESAKACGGESDAQTTIDYGWLLVLAEPKPERMTEIRSVLKRLPQSKPPYVSLVLRAALHSVLGKHELALEILKDAARNSITSTEMLGLSALVMNNAGDTNAATQRMAEALQTSKVKSATWEQRVRFELIRKRFALAAEQEDDKSTAFTR